MPDDLWIKLIKPLPVTLRLRTFNKDELLRVEHISYTLRGDAKGNRTKGYLVYDNYNKPICIYPEEIEIEREIIIPVTD